MIFTIDCPPIENFEPPAWAETAAVFASAEPVRFQQFWREAPEEHFVSGEVRAGWTPEGIWVYAVLEDADIHNEESAHNSFFFLKGDAFEIFVRPVEQEAYFEFHVGPSNQQLQMRFPSASAFASQKPGDSGGWKLAAPLMRSWVSVEEKSWRVLAFLPFEGIVEGGDPRQDWLVSFSRYDHTRGVPRPVLSSTSPHARLGFHRQEEWARLKLRSAQAAQ
jgi:hypothetical protein